MKIKTTKSKKPLFTGLIVLFLILLAFGIYIFYIKSKDQNTDNSNVSQVDLNPPTDEQKTAGDKIKSDSISGEGTTTPESTVNINITAANQNSSSLQVRTLIEAITSTGKCTLTLKKDSEVITKEVAVQALSSSSTCAGFDIPITELSKGSWQLTVDFKNDTLKGTVSRSIDVE